MVGQENVIEEGYVPQRPFAVRNLYGAGRSHVLYRMLQGGFRPLNAEKVVMAFLLPYADTAFLLRLA